MSYIANPIHRQRVITAEVDAPNLGALGAEHAEHAMEIIGGSPSLKRALQQLETVAGADSVVLILGETGAGKELVAKAIHQLSARRNRNFVGSLHSRRIARKRTFRP
jgi:transcriptional regulator with GAF, ATPase, and Fis domain